MFVRAQEGRERGVVLVSLSLYPSCLSEGCGDAHVLRRLGVAKKRLSLRYIVWKDREKKAGVHTRTRGLGFGRLCLSLLLYPT